MLEMVCFTDMRVYCVVKIFTSASLICVLKLPLAMYMHITLYDNGLSRSEWC